MALPVLAWAKDATGGTDVEPFEPVRWQLNMTPGVTSTSHMAYDAHMFALWVCVVIGVLVFGAMAVAMFRFRKSKGAVAAQFSHNTTAEIIWTIVPIVILVVMAWPATAKLIAQYDTRDSAMTVKVTGYQWMWKYEYLGEGVDITSRLDRASDAMRSERIGLRLYAMADDPICSDSNGSSISPNACNMRMSLLNFAADVATPDTTPSTCASSFRV